MCEIPKSCFPEDLGPNKWHGYSLYPTAQCHTAIAAFDAVYLYVTLSRGLLVTAGTWPGGPCDAVPGRHPA